MLRCQGLLPVGVEFLGWAEVMEIMEKPWNMIENDALFMENNGK